MSEPSAASSNDEAGGEGSTSPIQLPQGTRLRDQYCIEGVLGSGSFGITYRAHDERLDTTVAIKEYYPHEIAGRTPSTLVLTPDEPDDAEDFSFGRERFMEEGRTLARFDHPNIVRVRSYFEEHGTGYLVMDYYEGQTLARHLAAQGGTLAEADAVSIMQDVLRGLQSVHEEGLLHRDIDPQNIYCTDQGRIVLLDFGAARAAMEERSADEQVIFKPGYAPPEQYFRGGEQGPWTDVYACAATLYKCLTGMKPPAAGRRLEEDSLVAPHNVSSHVSLEVSVAVRRGLALAPDERPASVEAFAALLEGAEAQEATTKRAQAEKPSPAGSDDERLSVGHILSGMGEKKRSAMRLLVIGGAIVLLLGAAWILAREMMGTSEAAAPPRSVAVLPFESVGDADAGQFARGIHDDLLSRLSGISDLRVISRTSVLPYQETSQTLPEIAQELGVRWIVEGTVQQAGSQVQVSAQLINAREDTHEWGQEYQRALTPENLFAIQDELTTKIARSLEATLTTQEEERIARRPTENLEAYRLYVKGRALLDQRSDQGIRQAARYFRQALARDSSYALAWAGLADARSLLSLYGYAPADSVLPRALRAANRAVELNPDLAESHASRALVKDYRRNGPAAVRGYIQALDLNPNYARAHQWLGNLYLALGRLEKAVSHLRTAAELDPMSPSIHAALAGAYNRQQPARTDEALTHTARAKQLAPDYAAGHIVEGVALSRARRYEEALLALQRGLDMAAPGDGVRRLHLGKPAVVRLRMGDTTGARERLQRMESNDESPFAQAEVHAALGEIDAAFADLRRVTWAKFLAAELRYGTALDPLRSDPRYRKLVRTVNQIWGLNADGTLPATGDSATGIALGASAEKR
ncbi:hypothetical protein BSZ35_08710 [Salinibacter sp. 10B]|uniref:serine/threonine-protein kinase n=1 Tax=Salinibacter sp. 10B TaxID=1923971 RepID=UPI000CF43E7D|nr:serine/threonine-protein kinase [Salinibacter sp. 10B]PQJ34669.1 hypothetical protein BSZ35_08710 [Salinibacter sp. 10B]